MRCRMKKLAYENLYTSGKNHIDLKAGSLLGIRHSTYLITTRIQSITTNTLLGLDSTSLLAAFAFWAQKFKISVLQPKIVSSTAHSMVHNLFSQKIPSVCTAGEMHKQKWRLPWPTKLLLTLPGGKPG